MRILSTLCLLAMLTAWQPAVAKVSGCFAAKTYKPSLSARYIATKKPGKTTIIVLHGKNGWQGSKFFDPLLWYLKNRKYRIRVPQMPWGYKWDGSARGSG